MLSLILTLNFFWGAGLDDLKELFQGCNSVGDWCGNTAGGSSNAQWEATDAALTQTLNPGQAYPATPFTLPTLIN